MGKREEKPDGGTQEDDEQIAGGSRGHKEKPAERARSNGGYNAYYFSRIKSLGKRYLLPQLELQETEGKNPRVGYQRRPYPY